MGGSVGGVRGGGGGSREPRWHRPKRGSCIVRNSATRCEVRKMRHEV